MAIAAKTLTAQNAPITDAQILYYKNTQYGINLNSFGHSGLQLRYGWHKTGTKTDFIETELARIKHPKEVRRAGISENPNRYTFGRLNVAFFWRNGYGRTINITERPYKNALGLNFIYSGGINMALLKPVYLDIFYPDDFRGGGYINSEKYDPEKHTNIYQIYGNSSFFSGLGETKLHVGAYGRAALAVEWGNMPDEYKILEAGITVDAFRKGLPLMAFVPADQYFIGLYIAYCRGSKK